MARKLKSTAARRERVCLVGVEVRGKRGLWNLKDSVAELGDLARSAGAQVVDSVTQRPSRPSQTYLGKGKLEELRQKAADDAFDTVICDDELAPSQQRTFEQTLGGKVRVIDRTALILDVFAKRAQTREGRLQVELAQYEYLLPRLAGQWTHLERQRGGIGGGIGFRGPGEAQIETDRRIVRKSIGRIKKELDAVRRHRSQYRARRRSSEITVVGLVGYTNAGKSTLLNSLTNAEVSAEDRLFSTLDPVTRSVRLPSGRDILMTDTVGFIQKLPPAVVSAFRATLEEAEEAALLLHVVDISHRNAAAHAEVVEGILGELGLLHKPRLLVLNKTDRLDAGSGELGQGSARDLFESYAGAVPISALTGDGMDGLLEEIDSQVATVMAEADLQPMPQTRFA